MRVCLHSHFPLDKKCFTNLTALFHDKTEPRQNWHAYIYMTIFDDMHLWWIFISHRDATTSVGRNFCILPGAYPHPYETKEALEKCLFGHGAKILQNPNPALHEPSSTVIICSNSDIEERPKGGGGGGGGSLKFKNFVKQGVYDIMNEQWILRSLEAKVWLMIIWHGIHFTRLRVSISSLGCICSTIYMFFIRVATMHNGFYCRWEHLVFVSICRLDKKRCLPRRVARCRDFISWAIQTFVECHEWAIHI